MLYFIGETQEHLSHDMTKANPHDVLKENIPILGDSLFDNTVTYINDDLWLNPSSKTGIQKCKEVCEGRCMEYGITGHALCFAK